MSLNNVYNTPKKIYLDKLFPKINGVAISNLKIDNESVSYITTPHEAKKISDIIVKHLASIKNVKNSILVDSTGGVGGDTIMLSTHFGSIISIEIDSSRYSLLKHNIDEYKLNNVTTINGDSLLIIPKLSDIDVIYVDPPWGGKNYKMRDNLTLKMGSTELEQFILNCFNVEIMNCTPKLMALKLPKNYDLKHLFNQVSHKLDIYLYQLKKINLLIIEKKQINL